MRASLLVLYAVTLLLSPLLLVRVYGRRVSARKRFLLLPHLTRVGDLVVITGLPAAIKKQYPDAQVTVLVSKKVSALLTTNPHIDELMLIEDYAGYIALGRALRNKFDHVLILSGTAAGSALALFAEAPNRHKLVRRPRPITEVCTDWMANYRYLYNRGDDVEDLYFSMLVRAGVTTRAEREVYTTLAGEQKAEDFFEQFNHAPVIGFVVGVGYNSVKEWGDERFAALALRLLEKYSTAHVLCIAGPGDTNRVDALLERINNVRAHKVDNLSLAELPSFIKRLALLVSADTGPMHIAGALKVPLVDIVGPILPGENTPKGGQVRIVTPEGVEPTLSIFHPPGDIEESKRAASATSVDQVFEAAQSLLG